MPMHIGPERQLFLDDLLIESLDGLEIVMQRPVKPDAPVLEGTQPWERGVASIIGNSLHYDEEDGLFKAWYDTPGEVAYATSQDGVHWEKPSLGIREYEGSTDNNLISPGRNFSVIKDARDDDLSKRYKAMYWHSRQWLRRALGRQGALCGVLFRRSPLDSRSAESGHRFSQRTD